MAIMMADPLPLAFRSVSWWSWAMMHWDASLSSRVSIMIPQTLLACHGALRATAIRSALRFPGRHKSVACHSMMPAGNDHTLAHGPGPLFKLCLSGTVQCPLVP